MSMNNLHSINHSFEIVTEKQKVIADGYIQIGFQNMGTVPLVVCKRVLNPGEYFYPTVQGNVFVDETEYLIEFADLAGEKICWVHKTYVL